jgi:TolA-binding protein
MEPEEQPEADQPEVETPPPAAETARAWWKSPLRWPGAAVSGLKQLPRAFGRLKDIRHWPRQIATLVWANKLMSLIVVSSSLAVALPVLTFVMYQHSRHQQQCGAPATIQEIYAALERGDTAQTKLLAKRLLTKADLPEADLGVAPFALGAVAVFDAEKLKGKDRLLRYLVASRYFDEAAAAGFPDARRAEGLYLYGKSLYEIGDFAKCRTVLQKAMKIAPEHKSEIYRLLANACLNDAKANLADAIAQNALYLSDNKLPAADRQQGLLLKARIELRMDKLDDCRKTIQEIPDDSTEHAMAMVLGARTTMREAELENGAGGDDSEDKKRDRLAKYEQAVKTLRLAETGAVPGSDAMRQAMYLIGVCFMDSGDPRAANDQLTRLHKVFPDSPEGAAACLQQAELSRRAGHDLEMLAEYRRVLGGLDKAIAYFNPGIPPAELKTRLTDAYQQYLSKQQFEICLQLIGLMRAVLPAEQTRLMQADLRTKWGQYLLTSAEKTTRNKRESMRRLAREQFRRAGQDYAALAKTNNGNRTYSDYVWNAATSYLQGHNYTRSAALLRDYLQNEVQRRRPQALDSLGESLLCLGQYDAALTSLKECIEQFPRDAAACHARLLAAQAAREKEDIAQAEKMLLANLNGDYLTPASKEWRDSLLLLGDILHGAGRYDEAARRLEEAVKRYPDLPETIFARYLLADCCSRLAYATQEELRKDLAGSSRPTQTKRIQEDFDRALEQYRFIQEKLGGARDLAELSLLDKTMLRNSIFAIGDVLFAEADYPAAIKAYYVAANRYQNRPEVLDAYVQIANAYRRLDKPADAHNALQQAKLLLARMKPEVSFTEVSMYTRDQWNKRLDDLLQRDPRSSALATGA